jgi:tRNASer (uridine44-2'-O)-methyltransferase
LLLKAEIMATTAETVSQILILPELEQQKLPQDGDDPFSSLPNELWSLILTKGATFLPHHFHTVAENLIKNPNISSSCIFRADIYYDSATQAPSIKLDGSQSFERATKHLKEEYRPLEFTMKDYELIRTVVRQMIPRNPALDQVMVQTCHFFSKYTKSASNETKEDHILIMIPHTTDPSAMPFYHPKVRALALRYVYTPFISQGALSIYYSLFPSHSLDNRLERTALNLLGIVHKHATGQASGYTKRVHHDQVVPQPRFQNTYTQLKLRYAKTLIRDWAEQTDPAKHVFEDLGIAAFLIELWRDMYPSPTDFPGFVDIGCGNGVLVNILIQEGYRGWGFDARARKSWARFPAAVQDCISARILAPCVLKIASTPTNEKAGAFHDGRFPAGTFIVSNHADELTPWTPLVAYLNFSPFIAIPCCSHNLAGERCRFSIREKPKITATGTNNQVEPTAKSQLSAQNGPGPSTGSLARPKNGAKQPSAYQSLTTYVSTLAEELGFDTQKEMLRIPSTRNAAIVGRVTEHSVQQVDSESRIARVSDMVRREVGEMDRVVKAWLSQAEKIAQRPSGH